MLRFDVFTKMLPHVSCFLYCSATSFCFARGTERSGGGSAAGIAAGQEEAQEAAQEAVQKKQEPESLGTGGQ